MLKQSAVIKAIQVSKHAQNRHTSNKGKVTFAPTDQVIKSLAELPLLLGPMAILLAILLRLLVEAVVRGFIIQRRGN